MRNRWLFFTAIGCVSLVVASGFLAVRSKIPIQMIESNGYRSYTVRKAGLFPVVKVIPAPGLDVTATAREELKRLGVTMPAKVSDFLNEPSHSFQKESQSFHFHGVYPGSPKDASKAFRPWFGVVSEVSRPDYEQAIGTTPGKKASLYFTANLSRGVTYVNVIIGKPWGGELKAVEF